MTQQLHSWVCISEKKKKKKKTPVQPDTYTLMFTAALLTFAKVWKKPRYPTTDEWIKKMWYIQYTLEYYSAINKNDILPFTTT